MRVTGRRSFCAAALAGMLLCVAPAHAQRYERSSAPKRALYTGTAMVANAVPVVSAVFAPQCLPGYVVCKATFAFVSLVVATGQLALSGGGDMAQTRGILHRGFAGDWYLTGKHIAGDSTPQPLPEPPPPPAATGAGGWEPPPR